MPEPISVTELSVDDRWRLFLALLRGIRENAMAHYGQTLQNMNVDLILRCSTGLALNKATLEAYMNRAGLQQWAKDVERDQLFDLDSRIMDVAANMQAALDIIDQAIPRDPNEWILTHKLVAGLLEPRYFPAAGLTDLGASLNGLAASIILKP